MTTQELLNRIQSEREAEDREFEEKYPGFETCMARWTERERSEQSA